MVERDAPAASGTGGAATEAEVEAATVALFRVLRPHYDPADWRDLVASFRRQAIGILAAAATARPPSPAEAERDALHARELALMAEALTAAEADAARLREENDRLRALLAVSNAACPYCGLAATDMARCAHGFPGCARADDMMAHPAGLADLPPMPEPDPGCAETDDPIPDFDGPTPALMRGAELLREIQARSAAALSHRGAAPDAASPESGGGFKQSAVSLSQSTALPACSANSLAAENSDASSTTHDGGTDGRG